MEKKLALEIIERAEKFTKTSDTCYVKNAEIKECIENLGGSINKKAKRADMIAELKRLVAEETVEETTTEEEVKPVEDKKPYTVTGRNYTEDKPWFYLLIAGSRSYVNATEFNLITDKMLSVVSQTHNICIVSGGASGADSLAEQYAVANNYTSAVFPAQWDDLSDCENPKTRQDGTLYNPSAGFKRNKVMHDFIMRSEKRGCLCFWDGQSKGTAHNFGLAKERNTPLKVFNFRNRMWVKDV